MSLKKGNESCKIILNDLAANATRLWIVDLEGLLNRIYNSQALDYDGQLHNHLKLIKTDKKFIHKSDRDSNKNNNNSETDEILYSIQRHNVDKEFMVYDKNKNTIIIAREPYHYMVYYLNPDH